MNKLWTHLFSHKWKYLGTILFFIILGCSFDYIPLSPDEQLIFIKSTKEHSSKDSFLYSASVKRKLPIYKGQRMAAYQLFRTQEKDTSSLEISVCVLKTDTLTIAVLNFEGLLFPPVLKNGIEEQLVSIGENIVLFPSATHTHHGPGNWGEACWESFIIGSQNEDWIRTVKITYIEMILEAISHLEPSEMFYSEIEFPNFVKNRLTKNAVDEFPFAQRISLKRKSTQTDLFFFSAHPTCLPSTYTDFHGDYPAYLREEWESSHSQSQAIFIAGGVGAHAPSGAKKSLEFARFLGSSIAKSFDGHPEIKISNECKLVTLIPDWGAPHMRINSHFRVDTKLASLLGMSLHGDIHMLSFGEKLNWFSFPADVSGEFLISLKNEYPDKHWIFSSFNGGYVGYLHPSKRKDYLHEETTVLQWVGGNAGNFIHEVCITYGSTLSE